MPSKARPNQPPPGSPARVSLRDQKLEFVRNAIWTAAIGLFAEKGFDETTVDDIVAAAGASRRTFFRHFASKRDLVAYPALGYGAMVASAVDSCPPQAPLAELFRHVVLDVAGRMVSDPRTRKAMEVAARCPAAREAQLSRSPEIQDRVAEAFARRCRNRTTAQVMAGLTLAALTLTYRAWFSQGRKNIDAAARKVLAEISAIAGPAV